MCSGRTYRSTDMKHDLFRSRHDLDLRLNFKNDLLRSNYSSFDASRQEKHDACQMNVVSLFEWHPPPHHRMYLRPPLDDQNDNVVAAVVRELFLGWGAGAAQLTFPSAINDREKPRITPNLFFSSVLGHLFFILWPFRR